MSVTSHLLSLLASPPVLIAGVVALGSYILYNLLNSSVSYPSNYPRVGVSEGNEKAASSHVSAVFPTISAALKDGYYKFKDRAYLIKGKRPAVWVDNFVVVPPKWIENLKNMPEDEVSFNAANLDRFNGLMTYTAHPDEAFMQCVVKTISVDLTRHISKIMADMDDELNHAFAEHLPACDDWTPVYPGAVLPQIVALASGRIFVGLPLCRDPDFVKATITFTIDSFLAGEDLNKYPKFIRSWIAPWTKLVQTCKQQHITMQRLLKPELQKRMEMSKRGEELPADMMSWMIKNVPEERAFDLTWQAHAQLGVSLAAIHTTTMTASHAWLDMAEHPEYIQGLRDEWDGVLATEDTGVISKASMPKLRKLDSFLKESQRLNPLGPTTFDRKVLKDLTLPDGSHLPQGTYLAVAAQQIGMDKDRYENPEEFDGFRFEKLRQQPGNESRYQFATTGQESMYFGHGKHACPGRFFAANEIKLILSYLLRHYDMKFPEGESRPKNITTTAGITPDYTKPVLLRKRKV